MAENEKNTEVDLGNTVIPDNREKIQDTINPKFDKMLFLPQAIETKLTVVKPDDYASPSLIYIDVKTDVYEELFISFFVDGKKEPVTLSLNNGGSGSARAILLENEYGFDPRKTSFNYMIHPKGSK